MSLSVTASQLADCHHKIQALDHDNTRAGRLERDRVLPSMEMSLWQLAPKQERRFRRRAKLHVKANLERVFALGRTSGWFVARRVSN